MIHEYKGFISGDWYNWGELSIGDRHLIEELADLGFENKKVFVRYWISKYEKTKEDIIKETLEYLYTGKVEVDYYPQCGSEWTGQYGVEEIFNVGEHNLVSELMDHENKYCILEIEIID